VIVIASRSEAKGEAIQHAAGAGLDCFGGFAASQ